jgi:dTMP kinase
VSPRCLVCVQVMKKITKSFFICVEGIDGSGKSLFATALTQELTTRGYATLLTREPGGTPLGERIRGLLFDKQTPPCPKAEFLLFAASRAQHCHGLIAPALAEGKIVISDRMADSSLVYQGYVRGLSMDLIRSVNSWAMNDLTPTVIFYLKVDAPTAFNRISQRAMERCDFEDSLAPLEKAITGFDTIFAGNKMVITLDARQTPQNILAQGIEALQALL